MKYLIVLIMVVIVTVGTKIVPMTVAPNNIHMIYTVGDKCLIVTSIKDPTVFGCYETNGDRNRDYAILSHVLEYR